MNWVLLNRWNISLKSYRFNGRVINTALNYFSTKVNPEATGNGFIPRPVTKLDSLHTEFTARNYPDGPMYFNASATRYLLQFIRIAKENNIQVECLPHRYITNAILIFTNLPANTSIHYFLPIK
ncbi:MAG: hypothetical protein IPO49_00010 [Bacteroidetes bacterium]|nr:hypothetical protein [Bacteroidota bacterium]